MHRTPWTKSNSSLTSDLLKPKSRNAPAPSKQQGKNKHASAETPKSKDVQRLESLLQACKQASGNDVDPKGGCFCLARSHPLSPYAPLCSSCGLILCNVNLPYYCCPHCNSHLILPSGRDRLVDQLQTEVESVIQKEIDEKEKLEEAIRQAQGAFPTLSGEPISISPSPHTAPQTHKVLSLTQNKRVVKVASYNPTPVPSRTSSPNNKPSLPLEPERVPHPPSEPKYSHDSPKPERPFENLIQGGITYIPPPSQTPASSSNPQRSKRRRGKKDAGSQSATNDA